MPNWCRNKLTLKNEDEKLILKAANALRNDNFLNFLCPCPKELKNIPYFRSKNENIKSRLKHKYGYYNFEHFAKEEWGVDSEISKDSVEFLFESKNEIVVEFLSAWTTPVEALKKAEKMGFEVVLFYHEPNMNFHGIYENGIDEFCQDNDVEDPELRKWVKLW
jgi:hypothetical protein